MSGGRISSDPLFLGLTRPAIILGVTYTYFGLNMLLCTMYFVMQSDFKVIFVGVVIHVFGMLITKKEPLAVEILLGKIGKCSKCMNKNFHHGTSSYKVY